jgi:hypothetical protein
MRASLSKIRSCRAIIVILAVTWLPYITTRCVENPITHVGCPFFPGAMHAATHSDAQSPQRQHAQHHAPGHSCCDLTGKCNVRVAASPQAFDPPTFAVALPAAPHPIVVTALCSDQRSNVAYVAHSPPAYLRNATLLL